VPSAPRRAIPSDAQNVTGGKAAGRIGAIAVLGGEERNSVDSTFDSSNISDTNEIPGSQLGSH